MRFMIMMKGNEESEAGVLPDAEIINTMLEFNQAMADAGVLLAAEGLHPSSKGARVRLGGGKKTVIDGPFTEAKELIAGFWLIDVGSLDEAIEWVKRLPADHPGEAELEIRQVFEPDDDLGEQFTPDARAATERLREQLLQQ
jgi:hypothetical protein